MGDVDVLILLVEDDALDRMAVERATRGLKDPPQLVHASTIHEALHVLDQHQIDCVLADWTLPDGEAGGLLDEVRERSPDLPVIVLTGLDNPELAASAIERGAQDYLIKGEVSAHVLERSVRYAMQRKRVEQLNERLIHADRYGVIGRIAAGVAHEINNPAGWVIANMQFLEDGISEVARGWSAGEPLRPELFEEMRELLDECMVGMDRITDTVRQLRGYASLSLEEISNVDANALVQQCVSVLRLEARQHARIELELGAVPRLIGDAGALTQVVTNLLSNALHAIEVVNTPFVEWHTITVRTEGDEGGLWVVVEDTGPGVPEPLLERIFDPFFTTYDDEEHSGMGLTICRELVARHQGTLTLTNRLDARGARATIYLPRDNAFISAQSASDLVDTTTTPGAATRLRLLVVASPAHARKLQSLVQEHDVVTVSLLSAALDLLRMDTRFDGVFCDIMLPDGSSDEVVALLEQRGPEAISRLALIIDEQLSGEVPESLLREDIESLEYPFVSNQIAQILLQWS
ncbi:MAG: ATP-binding protein [Myxococcota bacterium]